MHADKEILDVLREAKSVARRYYRLTGKPLGVTGEIAEYEAAQKLGIELTVARQAGYDAIERANGRIRKLQIKGRCLQRNCKPGQRLGSIRRDKEWDVVLMVLLDDNFDAFEIHQAKRTEILKALAAPGSKARNERGALSVNKFKAIGTLLWSRTDTANVSMAKAKALGKETTASEKRAQNGVGAFCRALIADGKLTNNQILERVRAEFPHGRTTYACVACYRSRMRREAGESAKRDPE